ncbi:MAG: GNAT family N-acetyltransferase, partial [Anaerolineales bacterium]|nr:GNAT family N-acetyltransferase [Anaerolineales bacterium]MDW8446988.1 GNAT family N-acetyltransferase [Anaerolineales bacterium]
MVKQSYPPAVRPLDPSKDLWKIADLIELCFAETLDQSGREYIRQLRQVAKDPHYFWIGSSENHLYAPREGFVWEEEGKIVGNLSLFRFCTRMGIEYLIANVAVHPEFRRRGIAKLLTQRALDHIRRRGGCRAWLNVREDNQPAYLLYCKLEFVEQLRRTHWQFSPDSSPMRLKSPSPLLTGQLQIKRRSPLDWELHKRWLLSTYPPDYHWHLDFQLSCFKPGFLTWLRNFLNSTSYQHYSILLNQNLIGVATLQSTYKDYYLWMACDPRWEEEAFEGFLNTFLGQRGLKRKILLDYPASRAVQPL